MASVFVLEVFVHDCAIAADVDEAVRQQPSSGFPALPWAVAFQFLDYPVLVCYASAGPEPQPGSSAVTYTFTTGKSCMLQADAAEMEFLLEQVGRQVDAART
jgi:hypothetical protein